MLFLPTSSSTELQRYRRDPSSAGPEGVPTSVTVLVPLLDAAARLELDDRGGWERLRSSARTSIAVLVAGGVLPTHLAVGAADPPMLVSRTLAAAWRHVAVSAGDR